MLKNLTLNPMLRPMLPTMIGGQGTVYVVHLKGGSALILVQETINLGVVPGGPQFAVIDVDVVTSQQTGSTAVNLACTLSELIDRLRNLREKDDAILWDDANTPMS